MKNLIYLCILLMGSTLNAQIIPNIIGHESNTRVNHPHSFASIEGKVTDSFRNEPILFADVVLYHKGILITGTQTDFDGNYKFGNISPGSYDVRVSYVGYETKEITNVFLDIGKVTLLDIKMGVGISLDEIVVIEYKMPLVRKDNTSSGGKVTAESIRNLPTKDAAALIALTAGKPNKNKARKIKMRGSRTSGADYYLDGVRVGKKQRKDLAASSKNIKTNAVQSEPSLANKLTATEVNDFADWLFWSEIQETDFVLTSIEWNMNPLHRYSIKLKNTAGYALSGLTVELIGEEQKILWKTVSDNLGTAELFAKFEDSEKESESHSLRISKDGKIIDEIEAVAFNGNAQTLTVNEICQTSDMVELAFMMDISGSMGDEMAYLRSEISAIIDRVSIQYPGKTIRAGVVYFQGHGDRNTISAHPLTDDIDRLTDFIQGQFGGGGADEAIDLALQTMVEFDWNMNSTKIAFLMGDEELDNVEKNRARLRLFTKKSAEAGIKLVPIGCSGMPKSLEYVFRTMAIVTGGTYLALTDDSGVGGGHIKPTTNSIDVNSLNDIIFDVVTRFTHSNSCDDVDDNSIDPLVNAPDDNLNKKFGALNIDHKIKIFPNPTSGPFSIKSKNLNRIKEAFICDLAGRIVKKLAIQTRAFDISDLAVGNYFFLYKTNDGSFGAERIIKINGARGFARD